MAIRRAPFNAPSGLNVSRALQKVIVRVAIQQRADTRPPLHLRIGIANHDQPFLFVGDVKKAIDQVRSSAPHSPGICVRKGSTPNVVGVATAIAYFVGT